MSEKKDEKKAKKEKKEKPKKEQEPIITIKTFVGAIIGMAIGFLVLPIFWTPLLKILKGYEWIAVIISTGIFLAGYWLVKYAEGPPDVLGGAVAMGGYTLMVFSVWYWAPWFALFIYVYAHIVTVGLIIGAACLGIGLILIKVYKVQQKYLNDLGEIVGIIYGGFMIYLWLADLLLIPLLKGLGINLLAQITGNPFA